MVKKLNLNALQASKPSIDEELPQVDAVTTQESEPKIESDAPKKSLITLKKDSETSSQTTTTEESQESQAPKKAKISLRGFSKPKTIEHPQEEVIPNLPISTDTQNTNNEISDVFPVQTDEKTGEIEETKKEEMIIETQKETTTEEIKMEETKKEEVFAIMDGDTDCAIIKDDIQEIFSNYKGSFLEVKEEAKIEETKKEEQKIEIKADVKEAKSEIVEFKKEDKEPIQEESELIETPQKTDITGNETIEITPEVINEVQEEAVNDSTPSTPLQKVSEANKKKINKKVVIGSLISVLCISVVGFIFIPSKNDTASVIDAQSQPTTTETIPTPAPVENTAPENNNNSENQEIVKENEKNTIDNNDNNVKMQKLHNFLIKKYKIK